jgi:DMSO/TMAO reductase YedYZ molybdopterin-dependent catalytic subunit
MEQPDPKYHFRSVGDGSGLAEGPEFFKEELQLALRNRGMPLEGLRYAITPTGMHYLLVHYDIPEVQGDGWRLRLGGAVAKPLELTLEEIRQRPAQTLTVTMECAGNGRALFAPRRISQPWLLEAIGTAEWTGTPLRGILAEAGLNPGAAEIVFTGLDRGVEGGQAQAYQRSLSVEDAARPEVLLVYAMNGEPLPPQHGYPLRLLVPGWYGMASVKWLERIEAVKEPFQGYQMVSGYRYAAGPDDPGEPVSLIQVRALMVPPGIPDFLTRVRLVQAGAVMLTGRAWAGRKNIARVEVSTDGGGTWGTAGLGTPVSAFAWTPWSYPWEAAPGTYQLCVRATDADGRVQPLEGRWNFGGYGNNMVQRVDVIVE